MSIIPTFSRRCRSILKAGWAAVFTAALGVTTQVGHAEDINTFPQWNGSSFISSWGVPNTATYGQTFRSDGSFLPSFTFSLSQQSGTPPNYKAFVYAWNGTNIVGPALFAGPTTTAPGGANYQNVTVDTNGLSLAPGNYVVFFTTSTETGQANGTYRWGALTSNTVYPDGRFVFMNNGTNFNQLFTNTWSFINQDLAMLIKMPIPARVRVAGNYKLAPYSYFPLHIGGTGKDQFDNVTVDGRARLDGTLHVTSLNGYRMKRGDQFQFITARRGVDGKFATVINEFAKPGTILDPVLRYNKRSVVLEVPTFESFGEEHDFAPNQIAVGRGLDSTHYDKRANDLIEFLENRNVAKLPGDFDKIAPEELTSVFTMGVALAKVQSLNFQRRTADIRSGAGGFSAAGLAINGNTPSYSGGVSFRTGAAGPSGNESKMTKEVLSPEEKRWGAFLSGTGEWVSVDNTNNARGYDLDSGGFTLGVDYKLTPNLAVGLAAGYTGTTANLVDNGRVWVNGGKLGLYATFFQNQTEAAAPTMSKDSSKDSKEVQSPAASLAKGFYADVAAFGGYNSYDFRRSALRGDARGDTEGGELNVLAAIGYDFKKGNFTFGPTASFNYTYLGTDGFTENGSLAPLSVEGGSADSLRTAFGLRASYDWTVGSVLIRPEVRAAWQHEFGDSAYALSSSFANGAGDSFTVNGPQLGRDSVLLGAGFAVQFSERCATYFFYDGELGRKNYQSTSVTGGVRVAF